MVAPHGQVGVLELGAKLPGQLPRGIEAPRGLLSARLSMPAVPRMGVVGGPSGWAGDQEASRAPNGVRAAAALLPDRPDGCGVGAGQAAPAEAVQTRPAARRGPARGGERDPRPGADGLRLAQAAEGLAALADGLPVVPAPRSSPAGPDPPRPGAPCSTASVAAGRRARRRAGSTARPSRRPRRRTGAATTPPRG